MGSIYKSKTRVIFEENDHNFVLENEIANSGGMASIYRATVVDKRNVQRTGKTVALKIARAGDENQDVFERLLRRETSMLKNFHYPGVVRIYPFVLMGNQRYWGRATNLPGKPYFFVMELLSSKSLEDVKRSSYDEFSISWRVEVIYQIALALDYLHIAGMAHRDLKPDNVVFRLDPLKDKPPQPVLIDFGLAEKRQLDPEIRAATLTHASPERVEEFLNPDYRPITNVNMDLAAADLWALGIVAYELLNLGMHPYGDVYKMAKSQLADHILRGRPQPMRNEIPPKLRNLIMCLLEHDPKKRPKMQEFVERLDSDTEFMPPRI